MSAKKQSKNTKITDKKRIFAMEYLVDRNATRAAIKAGYSANSAHVTGCRLLKDPKVKALLLEHNEKIEQQTIVNAAWVRQQLYLHATADLRKLLDNNGNLLPVDQWPDDHAAAIDGLEINTILGDDHPAQVTKIKRTSTLKALELLGKHTDIQAFKEVVQHDVTDKTIEAIMAARKRSGRKD